MTPARTKPTIQMGRLADIAAQIAEIQSRQTGLLDLAELRDLRIEAAQIRRNLGMGPLRAIPAGPITRKEIDEARGAA